MKKRILLFTCSAFLFAGITMSYNGGPAANGQGNRTGSQGSTANCSTGGCHSANTPTTTDTVLFYLANGITGTTSWMPGQSYKIRLLVTSTNTAYAKFGFQMTSVCDSGAFQVQAGTFTGLPAGNVDDQIVTGVTGSPLQIVEHTFRQEMTPSITKSTGTVTLNWTAPNTDTIDTVKFYVIANAVNFDLANTGDSPNNAMWTFTRNTTSVQALNADIKTDIYPNPMSDRLNISMKNAENGVYSIKVFDMNGKVVANQTATVNKTYQTTINTAAWANGMYHVQLKKDGAQRTIAVVKQ